MRKLMTFGFAAVLSASALAASAQPPRPAHPAQPAHRAPAAHPAPAAQRYGHWDPVWGDLPPPPPRTVTYWRTNQRNWYPHVRNCMVRYKSYDPRRDEYRVGNRRVRCPL
jgi:hypothetical protein